MEREDITPELIKCLLRDQFPEWSELAISRVELEGWDNKTFRLGDGMSVRLPSGDSYSNQVSKEHQWLPVLAPQLPVAIPQPLKRGEPGCGYPWPWSVYRWLPGAQATIERISDLKEFAVAVGSFLMALQTIDIAGGPVAGRDTQFRGGPLDVWQTQTDEAIAFLDAAIDSLGAREVWRTANEAPWSGPPVWFHGDFSPSNLLVSEGHLSGVIDFGCCGVGDPACDLAIAWTFFTGESRKAFRESIPLDESTWARGRGWALWKALVTLAEAVRNSPNAADSAGLQFGWRLPAGEIIRDIIDEFQTAGRKSGHF